MTARERLGLERALGNLRLGIRWQRKREFSVVVDPRERPLGAVSRVVPLDKGDRTGLLQALVDTQSWLHAVLGKSSRLTKRYRRLTPVIVEHARRR